MQVCGLEEVMYLTCLDQSVVECHMSSLGQVGEIWHSRLFSLQQPHENLRGQQNMVLNIGDIVLLGHVFFGFSSVVLAYPCLTCNVSNFMCWHCLFGAR